MIDVALMRQKNSLPESTTVANPELHFRETDCHSKWRKCYRQYQGFVWWDVDGSWVPSE